MIDWLRVYNEAAIIPFMEAVNETRNQYYPNEIYMLKDAVSIPGILITYVLNKALKMKTPGDPDLCAPGQPCEQRCTTRTRTRTRTRTHARTHTHTHTHTQQLMLSFVARNRHTFHARTGGKHLQSSEATITRSFCVDATLLCEFESDRV